MPYKSCSVCAIAKARGLTVDRSKSNSEWGRVLGVAEGSIRRHYLHGERSVQEADEYRPRTAHPRGWEPGVKFDASNMPETITTEALAKLDGEPDWRAAVEAMGVTIPEGFRVRLAEMRFDPFAWTRATPEQKYAVTQAAWRYRFVVEPVPEVDAALVRSTVDIFRELGARPRKLTTEGDGVLALSWNDWQIGKAEGGGTDAIKEQLYSAFEAAADRIRDERRHVNELLVLGIGDMVDGTGIFPHQANNADRSRRDQINETSDLITYGLRRLFPSFGRTSVMFVGGNHGEHRVDGKMTHRDDNDDLLVFENAARDLNAEASVTFQRGILTATRNVHGHILGITHGHLPGKIGGQQVEGKVRTWFEKQAAGRNPIGDADVLVTAHWHHKRTADWGSTEWLMGPAMDGGSLQHEDVYGTWSTPGMLSWVMSRARRVSRVEVLT